MLKEGRIFLKRYVIFGVFVGWDNTYPKFHYLSAAMAMKHSLKVKEPVLEKINKNNENYTVEKSKGTAKKYNDL